MIKTLLIILYIVLAIVVIAYIDYGIRSHDLDFYSSKDNGYFIRFTSIIKLNTLFYFIQAIGKKKVLGYLKYTVAGFFMAIFISIALYITPFGHKFGGLTFHIITLIVCNISYFMLKKLKQIAIDMQE